MGSGGYVGSSVRAPSSRSDIREWCTQSATQWQKLWAMLKAAFRDARSAKNRSLSVRVDNPTQDVHGPESGVQRSSPGSTRASLHAHGVGEHPGAMAPVVRRRDVPLLAGERGCRARRR